VTNRDNDQKNEDLDDGVIDLSALPEDLEPRCRVRDLGLVIGRDQPGPNNAITDVGNVRVGHCTLISGEGKLRPGIGPVRTGVTAILPAGGDVFNQRVLGGCFTLNGAGEVSGLTQTQEWGLIETPIFLTNTLSVGTVSEGCVRWMVERYPGIGREHDVVIPLVGECDDSWLNDIAGRHVRQEHVFQAVESATSGPVLEGSVGGGTGMITCDFKGGIGTSSRKLAAKDGGYTVGVLVMTNFGHLIDLRMGGVPVGEVLSPLYDSLRKRRQNFGSIIAVFATDAPLMTHQLSRVAKRVALGIGRTGSYAAHASGEIILGFSTANRVPRQRKDRTYHLEVLSDTHIDPIYRVAVDATEEAILNALCMASTMVGANGRVAPGLPLGQVREIIDRYHFHSQRKAAPRPLRPYSGYAGPLEQVGPRPRTITRPRLPRK
jgi:D-aminopeptidase